MATICLNHEVGPRPSSFQHRRYNPPPPPMQKIIPDIFFFFFFFLILGLIMWFYERLDRMV